MAINDGHVTVRIFIDTVFTTEQKWYKFLGLFVVFVFAVIAFDPFLDSAMQPPTKILFLRPILKAPTLTCLILK